MINAFVISLLISYFLTPVVRRIALRIGAVDQPNHRRVNTRAVPNLGGLAVYAGLLVSLLSCGLTTNFLAVIIGAALIVGLGIIDDLYEISSYYKLVGQILVGLYVINAGVKIEFIRGYYLGSWSLLVTLGWLVGTINIINLIDGVDGLAGGVTVIAGATLSIFAYQQGNLAAAGLILALIGGVLGFLPYNLNPAQIFLGDTGSMLLGFILGIGSIIGVVKSMTVISFLIPLLALGVPIADTCAAVIRRWRRGSSLFAADKNHFHHQLLKLGLTHNQVAVVIYLLSLVLGMVAIGISRASEVQIVFLLGGLGNFLLLGSYKYMLLINGSLQQNKRK